MSLFNRTRVPVGYDDDNGSAPIAIDDSSPVQPTIPQAAQRTPIGNAVITKTPIARTPIGNPALEQDQAELQRLKDTGSGIDQFAKKPGGFGHKVASVLGRIGDVAGSIVAPAVAAQIPGTTMHHNLLMNQAQARVGQDLDTEQQQATIANTLAQPELKQAKMDADRKKLAAQLAQHGFKMDENDSIIPLPYEEMSEEQQAVHDLKASQSELADARAAYTKAQKENQPKLMEMAQQRINTAQQNANTAQGKLGLAQKMSDVSLTPEAVDLASNLYKQTGTLPGGFSRAPQVTASVINKAAEGGPTDIAANKIAYGGKKSTTTYFTSGSGGKQLNAFNTAITHLDTLERLSGDLNNGDIQTFNKAAQAWSEQTGNPAPANFEAAKNAMSGEVAAALKASGATDQEIAHVGATFNRAQSPAQLKGAINTYRELLKSKADQLKKQYESGMQGKPAFNEDAEEYVRDPKSGRLVKK